MRLVIACVLAFAAVALAQNETDYVFVPGGWRMHKSCVHRVPSGTLLNRDNYPRCQFAAIPPNAQIYATDASVSAAAVTVTDACLNSGLLRRRGV